MYHLVAGRERFRMAWLEGQRLECGSSGKQA